jgi:hypothetical protein
MEWYKSPNNGALLVQNSEALADSSHSAQTLNCERRVLPISLNRCSFYFWLTGKSGAAWTGATECVEGEVDLAEEVDHMCSEAACS